MLSVTFSSCKRNYAEQNPGDLPEQKMVKAVQPERHQQATPLQASGVLVSDKEMTLSFKTGGIIQSLHVKEGERVEKGRLLASLDLTEINARVNQAETRMAKAGRDLERIQKLYRDSAATLEQVQDLETAYQVARQDLEIARFNQKHSRITSPVNGKILNKHADEEELITGGNPVYTIGSSGTSGAQLIRVGVPDHFIVKLSMGDTAHIRFDPFPQRKFTARVTKLAENAHPATGLFQVELTLEGYYPELRNGFIGKAVIYPSEQQDNYKLPTDALVEGNGHQATIYYTTNKVTAVKKDVTIMDLLDDHFTVKKRTLPGDAWIITDGAAYLTDNDSIQIIQ